MRYLASPSIIKVIGWYWRFNSFILGLRCSTLAIILQIADVGRPIINLPSVSIPMLIVPKLIQLTVLFLVVFLVPVLGGSGGVLDLLENVDSFEVVLGSLALPLLELIRYLGHGRGY